MFYNSRKAVGLLVTVCAALFFSLTAFAEEPAFSEYWQQDAAGNWIIRDGDGNMVRNAWLCDDAVPANGENVWYLIDQSGKMIAAGLVQDGTGNFYSLEMNHNGHFGMLRYESGTYTADGLTVTLTLEGSHNGSFAAIRNEKGIAALKEKYGVTSVSIDNSNCVYTSSFAAGEKKKTEAAAAVSEGRAPGGDLTAADFLVTGDSVPAADMIAWTQAQHPHDAATYYYYSSGSDTSRESVVKTARGITLASLKSDVTAAYGSGTPVSTEDPAHTGVLEIAYRSDPNGVKKYLRSCLAYYTADGKYAILFGFKDSGQVSFIFYYVI